MPGIPLPGLVQVSTIPGAGDQKLYLYGNRADGMLFASIWGPSGFAACTVLGMLRLNGCT